MRNWRAELEEHGRVEHVWTINETQGLVMFADGTFFQVAVPGNTIYDELFALSKEAPVNTRQFPEPPAAFTRGLVLPADKMIAGDKDTLGQAVDFLKRAVKAADMKANKALERLKHSPELLRIEDDSMERYVPD